MPIHPRRSWRRFAAAALVFLLGTPHAQAPQLSETEVKAALVFNFARYVDWPASAFASGDAPFVMCLISHDAHDRFAPAFAALGERSLKGRAVRVRLGVAPDQAAGCHAAFLAETPPHGMVPVVHALTGQGVLTVSDADGFIDSGGAIGIVPGQDRLQFEINRDTLNRAGLSASSQLLKLAHALIGKSP